MNLGYGNGQFRQPITSITTGFPVSVAVSGDFNGDHKVDIAFLSFAPGQPALAVVLGNGDGTFGATTTSPVPSNASNLVAGDVNGDGKVDLVVSEGGNLQVFLGNGDGTFQALGIAPGGSGCVLADVNHDGKLDLIGSTVQLGNGDGTFQDAQTISDTGGCPAVADFDGDGNLDVAVVFQGGVNFYFGNGDGTFRPPAFRWTSPMDAILVGDFNGDGKPDLLGIRGSEIDVLLNAGKALFQPAVGYMAPGSPLLGDFNGDGRTDVMFLRGIASNENAVTPALAGPGGTFSVPRSFFVPGGITSSFSSGRRPEQ